MAPCKQGFQLDGAGLPPLPPRRLASLLALHSPIRRGRRAPPAGLASGAASPELVLWAGTQTRRIRHQPPAHVSAGEESAREATSVTHFQGTHGVSLWVCGAAKPNQGPLEPGALRAALSLGSQATSEAALQLPLTSSRQSSQCWSPWQCVTQRSLSPPQAHVSAGEESAREPTCVRQLLGAHRVSHRVWGAADPSKGPLKPGALRAALSLGGQATAEGSLLRLFASL